MSKWMKCCFESERNENLLLNLLFPIPLSGKIESREEWGIRDYAVGEEALSKTRELGYNMGQKF